MQSRTHKKAMVLNELRKNCRQHLTQVGRGLRLPATTVFELERDLRDDIIMRYVSIPLFSPLGFPLRISCVIQCPGDSMESIIASPFVNNLFLARDGTLLCDAVFLSINQQIEFEELIFAVGGSIKLNAYVLEVLKNEGATFGAKSPKNVRNS
jgi:DNA-binding Lrp family transcriptional regulator